MMSTAPMNGAHVMTESTGQPLMSARPSAPDEEQEHAQGHAVDVVLREPGLEPAQAVAEAERPGAEEVHDAVHDVAVDPADDARHAQDDAPVNRGEQVVEPEALDGRLADQREGAGQ